MHCYLAAYCVLLFLLYASLWVSPGMLFDGVLKTFLKWSFSLHLMHLLPKARHLLGLCVMLQCLLPLLVMLHELFITEFSWGYFICLIMSKSLFSWILISMAFWALCASILFGHLSTCLLIMSLAFCILVSSL